MPQGGDSVKRVWLEDILQQQSLTHQEVANKAKIDRAYFTQIVNGVRRPSPDVAQRIGKVLKFNWTLFFTQKCGEKPQSGPDQQAACLPKTG
jgi:transcriptional regulator with XRE-family HTH domain